MALVLSSARRLGLSQEVAHDAVQLLDRLGAEAADSSPTPLAALLLLASRQGTPRLAGDRCAGGSLLQCPSLGPRGTVVRCSACGLCEPVSVRPLPALSMLLCSPASAHQL